VVSLTKPFIYQGFLAGRTATVSKSVSHGADGKTIRQNWPELAETLPSLAFINAVDTGPEYRNRYPLALA
jgi:hypothetical protein